MSHTSPAGRPPKRDEGSPVLVATCTLLSLLCLIAGFILMKADSLFGRELGVLLAIGGVVIFVFMCIASLLADRRHRKRKRQQCCIECGYPIISTTQPTPCPECGAAPWFVDTEPSRVHHTHQHMKHRESPPDDTQVGPGAQ